MKTITLAGGCFWGMERLYRALGVADAVVGYANGDSAEHANYPTVCTGDTGFREAVQITYDPERISLKHLLFVFFGAVDVTMYHRQGMDIGSQYQTGIYWSDPTDEQEILAIADMEKAGVREFYVELKPLECFYDAEEYHQRYLEKNPAGYCHLSPMRIGALTAYPYDEAAYTRPAAVLLQDYMDKRS